MLTPFKFVVQAVLLDIDKDGKPLGEQTAEPVALYGVDAVREWIDSFDDKIVELNATEP